MNIFDTRSAIQWTLRFQQNLAPPDRELTAKDLTKAAQDCMAGRDAWESAHEINAAHAYG